MNQKIINNYRKKIIKPISNHTIILAENVKLGWFLSVVTSFTNKMTIKQTIKTNVNAPPANLKQHM